MPGDAWEVSLLPNVVPNALEEIWHRLSAELVMGIHVSFYLQFSRRIKRETMKWESEAYDGRFHYITKTYCLL